MTRFLWDDAGSDPEPRPSKEARKKVVESKSPGSDPEAPIWRFMNLRKFKDLLATSELFFNRADPRQIIGAGGLICEQLPQVGAPKGAKHHVGRRLDGMLHLTHDACLKADEIARKDEIYDLSLTV